MKPRPQLPPQDDLRERAHAVIPGGAHTYAKGDDQWPAQAPAFLVRGLGSRVWDVFGNEYLEYGQGLRSVGLGHGHPAVAAAVVDAVRHGTNFVRPSLLEQVTAEAFLDFIGHPDWQVKFAKNGSDATTAAVRLARAATGRDLVGVCVDQPFFSTDDWFIATTPMHAGIPDAIADLSVTFPYGDLDALDRFLAEHGARLAALILEAAKYADPAPGFLEGLVARCHEHGVLVILDEMITGFRWPTGTAMGAYGIEPDLATFGKAMANGVSVAAIAGRPDLMELGGLRTTKERVFLLSTTHGAESIGLAACLATMQVMRRDRVLDHLQVIGSRLLDEVPDVLASHGVGSHLGVMGLPQSLVWWSTDGDGLSSQGMRSLVLQELARMGVLAPSLIVSGAHLHGDVDRTLEAFDHAAQVVGRALEDGVEAHLVGPPSAVVLRRFVDDP